MSTFHSSTRAGTVGRRNIDPAGSKVRVNCSPGGQTTGKSAPARASRNRQPAGITAEVVSKWKPDSHGLARDHRSRTGEIFGEDQIAIPPGDQMSIPARGNGDQPGGDHAHRLVRRHLHLDLGGSQDLELLGEWLGLECDGMRVVLGRVSAAPAGPIPRRGVPPDPLRPAPERCRGGARASGISTTAASAGGQSGSARQ